MVINCDQVKNAVAVATLSSDEPYDAATMASMDIASHI
jgi:hypothetical protein